MEWLQLILFLIILVLLVFSSVYAVKAAAELAKFDYKSKVNLDRAHKWLTYASIVGWVGVGLIVIGIVASFYTGSGIGKLLSFFTIAVVIALGVLCALGWDDLDRAPKDVSDIPVIEKSKHYAMIATLTSIIGGVILFGLFLYLTFRKKKKKIIYVGDEGKVANNPTDQDKNE